MIEKLKASARDVVLAGVAAFVGSFSIALKAFVDAGDVSIPAVKAFAVGAVIAAAYAALRAALGALAAKLAAAK